MRISLWPIVLMLIVVGATSAAFAQSTDTPPLDNPTVGKPTAQDAKALIGTWSMVERLGHCSLRAVVVFSVREGRVEGTFECMGRTVGLTDIRVDGETVSYRRVVAGERLEFAGTLAKNQLRGSTRASFGELPSLANRHKKKHTF